jgi:Protein of unknown function (DUF1569)
MTTLKILSVNCRLKKVEMNSIFEINDYNNIATRINNVTGTETAQWGKMNVGQMLAHCIEPLEVASGDKTIKSNLIMFLFKGIIKKAILGTAPYKRSSPTMKNYTMTGKNFDVQIEKQLLLKALERFKNSEATAEGRKHPICGAFTKAEWGWSQYKHLDYHLAQFGV